LSKKKENPGEKSFEESAKQLAEIVALLEDDKVELDEAINLFSQGIDTLAECKEKLSIANGKITELKKGKNGKLVEEILNLK
jgi:exodeoxyribonuclease VII small subunit